jgi:hypothetical protein
VGWLDGVAIAVAKTFVSAQFQLRGERPASNGFDGARSPFSTVQFSNIISWTDFEPREINDFLRQESRRRKIEDRRSNTNRRGIHYTWPQTSSVPVHHPVAGPTQTTLQLVLAIIVAQERSLTHNVGERVSETVVFGRGRKEQ